jgi:eukaryotic-like serine/threonine-protein kinase
VVRVAPGGVFISYRREDSPSYGTLLYVELSRLFGQELVFLDIESLQAGADYVEQLLARVRCCRVLLAVIGPRWLTATGADGRRRIEDPDDWVRRELAEAFAAGVRVIPVLIDGADMPIEADLPADIAALGRCQARRLRHHDAISDLDRIRTDLVSVHPDLAAAVRRSSLVEQTGTPAVVEPANVPGAIVPFVFDRTAYRDRKALARAMARSWDTAARRYFAARGTGRDPSEAWRALRTWLQQFNDPTVDDVEALQDLIDQQLSSPELPQDVKLLALLRWLDPTLLAVYRGLAMSRDDLWAVAQGAADDAAEDHLASRRVVDDLYVHRLLPQLAAMDAPDLEAINEAWASNRAEYDRRAAELSTLVPKTERVNVDESMLNAELLALALYPQRQAEAVRAAVDRILGALPVPIDWFDRVREAAQPSPIDGLVLTRLGAAAIRQSQAMAQQLAEAEAERRQRQLLWDKREVQRLAAMRRSKRMAAGYLIGTWIGAVVLPVISALFYQAEDPVFLWVWLLANLAAGVAAACYISISELNLVKELGSDYQDARRFSGVGSRLRYLAGAMTDNGWVLLAVLVAGLLGLGLIAAFPIAAYATFAALHGRSTYRRRSRWQQWHADQRRAALGES